MQTPHTVTHWIKHWLFDWGGANVDLFQVIQRTLPDGWIWLPELLTALGSYWGAPVVVVLLLLWRRVKVAEAISLTVSLYQFLFGLALALATAALAKALLALPRPFLVLGDAVYRATSASDSRYTMPSGHSVYVGVLAAALWSILGWSGRIGLLVFATAVGWSRIVLGAHFPMDVLAGFALGWASVAVVGPLAQCVARNRRLVGASR